MHLVKVDISSLLVSRSIHFGYTLEGTCRLKTCEIPLVAICFYHLLLAAASTIFHASTQKIFIIISRCIDIPFTWHYVYHHGFHPFFWFPGFSNGTLTSCRRRAVRSTQGQVCLQIGRERGENDLRKATRRGGHLSQGGDGSPGRSWRLQGLQAAKMPRVVGGWFVSK